MNILLVHELILAIVNTDFLVKAASMEVKLGIAGAMLFYVLVQTAYVRHTQLQAQLGNVNAYLLSFFIFATTQLNSTQSWVSLIFLW